MPALNGGYTPNYDLYLPTLDDQIDDLILAMAENFTKLDAGSLFANVDGGTPETVPALLGAVDGGGV